MLKHLDAFNQEKALVGAFSVITNHRVDLRFKLYCELHFTVCQGSREYSYPPLLERMLGADYDRD